MAPAVRILTGVLTLAVSTFSVQGKSVAAPDVKAHVDMPFGVLISTVRSSGESGARTVFTNDAGLPLYYLQNEDEGKVSCRDDCEKTRIPVLAAQDDKPVGHWTIFKRDRIRRQWAYNGKPVYTFAKDVLGQEDLTAESSRHVVPVALAKAAGADGNWHLAGPAPAVFEGPKSMSVSENARVPGQILVNGKGMSLYMFTGTASAAFALKLSNGWQPVLAGFAELPKGEYSIIKRIDGRRQWAFRKRPLFSYDGDMRVGDLNGKDVVSEMEPAVVFHYFSPANVKVSSDIQGGRLVTETGQALYVRDRIIWNQIRGDRRGAPERGREIGLSGCDAACEQEWLPFRAPASARGNGYWNVIVRPDGTKQWTYQGYALYTNADEGADVAYHNEIYDVMVNDSTEHRYPPAVGLGLYWRIATP